MRCRIGPLGNDSQGAKLGFGWQLRALLGRLHNRENKEGNRGTDHDHGFALLIVVITVVVLSLLLASVITANDQAIDQSRARLSALKLRAAIEGAVLTAVHELSGPSAHPGLGTLQTIRIGDVSVDVTIRPEAAKLDINYASKDVLVRLLRGSGLKDERALEIANEIIAWRTGARHGGSVDRIAIEQEAAGPPSQPFETLADLAAATKEGADLVACLGSDLSIYTHSPQVDVTYASERVRNSLFDEPHRLQQGDATQSVVGGSAGFPDLYELTASASDQATQVTLRRQIVFRVTGDPKKPAWILADRSSVSDARAETAACNRLAAHER